MAARSVWYKWVTPAASSGLYSFSTSGSSFDTVMAIYACPASVTCTFANMSLVASNDDTTEFDKTSKVNFRANAGTQYMIAVDGKGGATGTIVLSWRQYERLFRLYLQDYNGNPSTLVPDTVTAGNGTNTVVPLNVSRGVYEFTLPADGTIYLVNISGPTGIVWDPNNFPLDTSFRMLDELMNGPAAGAQNSVSNAQNQTPRYVYGYIRNITAQERATLSVSIGSSRGPNPRDAVTCDPIGSTFISSLPFATYQCLSQPQTIHDIVPNMPGKNFVTSVRSYNRPIDNDEFGVPSSGFTASAGPTYNISGNLQAGDAGALLELTYTPAGNTDEITLRTTTDTAGHYEFRNLASNLYKLKASKTGFVFTQPPNINLQSDQVVDIPATAACTYTPQNLGPVPIDGSVSQFTIKTNNPTCAWTASSNVPWLTIYSGSTVASGPVFYTIEPNTGLQRIGSIRVSGRSDLISFPQIGSNSTYVSVTGKVTTPDTRGLKSAVVIISDSLGNSQSVTTNSFGIYTVSNILSGVPYTISVSSKHYRFVSRTVLVDSALTGVDFVGVE